jgi:hypothetical protein
MARMYQQLSLAERVVLQTQLQLGLSPAVIAAGLNRARSTITREMARNGWQSAAEATAQSRRWGNGMYLARTADLRARRMHRKPRVQRKLVPGTPLWQFVLAQLRRHLSPAQIASTLARMPTPVRISHETFYATFYAMRTTADLLADFEQCPRKGNYARNWKPKRMSANEFLYDAIRVGATTLEKACGEEAGSHVMGLAAYPGLEMPKSRHLYDSVIHLAALADILTSAVRRPQHGPWLIFPRPQLWPERPGPPARFWTRQDRSCAG